MDEAPATFLPRRGGGLVRRLLVASPSALARRALEAALSGRARLSVVGTASTPEALREQVDQLYPDLVILDAGREEAWSAAARAGTGPPLLVILTDEAAVAAEWLRVGARAVLGRAARATELEAAVHAAVEGLLAVHPDFAGAIAPATPAASPRSDDPRPGQALTPREVEVLRMLAEGVGNKAIAVRLGISDHTVKFHISSILAKLNATTRTEAVTIGVRQGMILL